jgi:hypothetical protein
MRGGSTHITVTSPRETEKNSSGNFFVDIKSALGNNPALFWVTPS